MKQILLTITFVISSVACASQRYVQHSVTSGETVTSIARNYKVSPFDIIKLNPDAKQGIHEGMRLVIPTSSASMATVEETPRPVVQDQEHEVVRFIAHKVRRKETLFGIAQRYGVTVDDIKRYNRELYSKPLKRRMKIRVPKFKEATTTVDLVEDVKNDADLIDHVVKPKETIWSLAHQYGLTVAEFRALNPNVGSGLKIGETVQLPNEQMAVTESEEDKASVHVVQPKETLYSLTKKYNVSVDELIRLNPSLKDGLKAGMTLNLPRKQNTSHDFIFYEVKPKETMYSLQKKLNMDASALEALNPALKDGLKAGMVLKLPAHIGEGAFEVDGSVLVEKFNILDSLQPNSRVKVAFMIPFRLNSIPLDSSKVAVKRLSRRNLYTVATDFYAGARVAMDFASDMGISVHAKIFDTENSATKLRSILATNDFQTYQAVVGPLIPDNLELVASQLRSHDVPVVSPLSDKRIRSYRNVFQSVPDQKLMRDRMLTFLKEHGEGKNVMVVADSKNESTKERLVSIFPDATIVKVEEDTYISFPDMQDRFTRIPDFSETWVILETDNLELITSVTSVLNSQVTETKKVTLLTTNKGDVYDDENVSNSYLSSLNFHFPSAECPTDEAPFKDFTQRFYKAYHMMPNRDATRGFDVTLDVILRLAYKQDMFEANGSVPSTRLYEGKFQYGKKVFGGYENQGTFIVKYDGLDLKEVR